MCSDVCGIGLEIGHELGLGAGGLLHDFFRKGLIIEKDHLLFREVDGKVHNSWVLMVNPMPHESPDCLICTNIASIQVLLDLIRGFAKLHGSAVMALVYIFVDILDAPYSKGQLHIDVTYKEKEEEGHMGNHPLVVKLGTTNVMFPAIIPVMIRGVAITAKSCGCLEWFWKMFGALAINHTGCIRVGRSTGAMGHELFDQLIQVWLGLLVRKLSRDQAVNILRGPDLVLWCKPNQEVHVR